MLHKVKIFARPLPNVLKSIWHKYKNLCTNITLSVVTHLANKCKNLHTTLISSVDTYLAGKYKNLNYLKYLNSFGIKLKALYNHKCKCWHPSFNTVTVFDVSRILWLLSQVLQLISAISVSVNSILPWAVFVTCISAFFYFLVRGFLTWGPRMLQGVYESQIFTIFYSAFVHFSREGVHKKG